MTQAQNANMVEQDKVLMSVITTVGDSLSKLFWNYLIYEAQSTAEPGYQSHCVSSLSNVPSVP